MVKRITLVSLFLIILMFNAIPVFAAGGEDPVIKEKLDRLLSPAVVEVRGKDNQKTVPIGSLKYDIVPQAIKIFLAVAATISFIVFVYAGVMLVIAQGNEEEITKFKNVLIWSIVGLLFITAAYALVRGVLNLSFT